ncbi:hypothetical protein EDB85DRAFT_2280985 [Lactarius pseudohatsudake]|nr:hypothetical protein EDB85DRAFT_2280985 [Lactarius pseudohatsudake]
MCDDLGQYGLGLVPEHIVGRLVPVHGEPEWFLELPLEVQRQAHGNLVAGTSTREYAYVHRRHLELILANGVEPAQHDVRMGDTVLSGREELEIVAGLQNRAIIRWDVQSLVDEFAGARGGSHADLEAASENGAGDTVLDPMWEMRLVDDCEHIVATRDAIRNEARVLQHKDVVLRVRDDRCLVLRHLFHGEALEVDHRIRYYSNPYRSNEPGVLSRVSGILAGRGFNIDSLVVYRTEIRDLSHLCIVISGQDGVVEQARRQLENLVPVWAILDYTERRTISRELLLVKLEGGPSHEPRAAHRAHAEQTKLEREKALARHFEESTRPQLPSPTPAASEGEEGGKPLTLNEALRQRHLHLHSLANQFGARLVDVSE